MSRRRPSNVGLLAGGSIGSERRTCLMTSLTARTTVGWRGINTAAAQRSLPSTRTRTAIRTLPARAYGTAALPLVLVGAALQMLALLRLFGFATYLVDDKPWGWPSGLTAGAGQTFVALTLAGFAIGSLARFRPDLTSRLRPRCALRHPCRAACRELGRWRAIHGRGCRPGGPIENVAWHQKPGTVNFKATPQGRAGSRRGYPSARATVRAALSPAPQDAAPA